jgi:competence protein CoiA
VTVEKHIADIVTNQNLVVEFQHSYILPEERVAREAFYKNMIWVVDGARRKRDCQRFLKGRSSFVAIGPGLYKVFDFEDFWPACWIGSHVPVVVDFSGVQSTPEDPSLKDVLYCLFPTRIGRYGVVAALSREILVGSVKSGNWSEWSASIVNGLELLRKEQVEKSRLLERQKTNAAFRNLMGFKRVRRRRF